jgi:hypothetical protein
VCSINLKALPVLPAFEAAELTAARINKKAIISHTMPRLI